MEKMITVENIRSFAYENGEICQKPVKGIVLAFRGLGGMAIYDTDTEDGQYFAKRGILYVVPYNDPWGWMNKQQVAYTDEIVDVLIRKYGLEENIPIISTGRSMGGLGALIYMIYGKRTPASCVTNCPVCDAVYHYTERPELPCTLYNALFWEKGTMKEALEAMSPIHLAHKMPKVNYYILHCEKDLLVNKERHSDAFVQKMRQLGYHVTYQVVPERNHCELTEEAISCYLQYAVDEVEAAQ